MNINPGDKIMYRVLSCDGALGFQIPPDAYDITVHRNPSEPARGSVVLDSHGRAYQRRADGWRTHTGTPSITWSALVDAYPDFTVIYEQAR